MLVIKQLTVTIDIEFQNTMELNVYHQLSGYQHSLKYLLCLTEAISWNVFNNDS